MEIQPRLRSCEGETVLDLGSGGGIDVLLSARRVGDAGFAYGVDATDEMLDLARTNAVEAGARNVEFLKGTIEEVPLPDGSVDVVISNCVINLSTDKPKVLSEMFRVLKPGGRIGISDVVAEDQLSAAQRAERGEYAGCMAGALSRREYLDGLAAVGFADASVRFTHEAEPRRCTPRSSGRPSRPRRRGISRREWSNQQFPGRCPAVCGWSAGGGLRRGLETPVRRSIGVWP